MNKSGLETIVKNEPTKGQILGHMTKGIMEDLYSRVTEASKMYIFGNLPADIYEKLYSKGKWRYSEDAKDMTTLSSAVNIPLYITAGAVVGLATLTPTVAGAALLGCIGAVYGLFELLVRQGTVNTDNRHAASLLGCLLSIPLRPVVNTAVNLRERYETAKSELSKQ